METGALRSGKMLQNSTFFTEKRQTMLFSATTTKKTEDLIKVALKKEPIYVGLEDQTQGGSATVTGLEQVEQISFLKEFACSNSVIPQMRGK